MRKATTILITFTLAAIGIWFFQTSILQAAQNAPNEQRAVGIWQIETVDSQGNVGQHSSLVIDNTDNPHISYSDTTSGTLKYAHWDGSNWLIETVDHVGNNPSLRTTSLVLDSFERPHISYYDIEDQQLKYAYWNGLAWQMEIVANSNSISGMSLALDSANQPHISYSDGDRVKYAQWDGNAWIITYVGSDTNVTTYTSLVLDSQNRPHISYANYPDNNVKYAYWNDPFWEITEIDTNVNYYGNPSLALDSNDNPHISYSKSLASETTLAYASWDGSTWHTEIVTNTPAISSSDSSLTLDSFDHPHISFGRDSYYAHWDGTGWQVVLIDAAGTRGSIALDSSDQPMISYYLVTSQDLNLARWQGPVSIGIGLGGGTFTPSNGISFTFPTGAFSQPVTVTYMAIAPISSTLPNVGVFYELTAVSTATNQPAQLEPGQTFTTVVQYNEANVPSGVSEDSLKLFYQTGGAVQQPNSATAAWEPASSSVVDTAQNEITAVDSHLGVWAVFSDGHKVYLPAVIKP